MVDALDSKSSIRKGVRVRVSPSAPNLSAKGFPPNDSPSTLWSVSRAEIEQLCVQRKRDELLSAVSRWVKRGGEREYSDGMEWLWRAGMFKEVLLLSIPKNATSQSLNVEKLGPERSLWIARAWSALGAWPFAEQFLRRIPTAALQTPEARALASLVLSSLGYYVEALALLPRTPLHKEWGAGWQWQCRTQEMFCLTQLDQAAAVEKCLDDLKRDAPHLAEANREHLDAIAAYTEGLLKGAPAGVVALQNYLDRLPDLSKTHPRVYAVAVRWLAVFLAKSGQSAAARREFFRALRAVRRESEERLPQSEMQVLALYESAGLSQKATLRRRLQVYPGLTRTSAQLLGLTGKFATQNAVLGEPSHSEIHLWEGNGECRVGGAIRPTTPLELVLAGIIARAGKNGIGVSLLFCLLWPEEAWNWQQFSERLAKLVSRLRKIYGISIVRRRECLLLATRREAQKISISFDPSDVPSFLIHLTEAQQKDGFRSADVARYYDLSDRHALNFVKQWVESGRVLRQGSGPKQVYFFSASRPNAK